MSVQYILKFKNSYNTIKCPFCKRSVEIEETPRQIGLKYHFRKCFQKYYRTKLTQDFTSCAMYHVFPKKLHNLHYNCKLIQESTTIPTKYKSMYSEYLLFFGEYKKVLQITDLVESMDHYPLNHNPHYATLQNKDFYRNSIFYLQNFHPSLTFPVHRRRDAPERTQPDPDRLNRTSKLDTSTSRQKKPSIQQQLKTPPYQTTSQPKPVTRPSTPHQQRNTHPSGSASTVSTQQVSPVASYSLWGNVKPIDNSLFRAFENDRYLMCPSESKPSYSQVLGTDVCVPPPSVSSPPSSTAIQKPSTPLLTSTPSLPLRLEFVPINSSQISVYNLHQSPYTGYIEMIPVDQPFLRFPEYLYSSKNFIFDHIRVTKVKDSVFPTIRFTQTQLN